MGLILAKYQQLACASIVRKLYVTGLNMINWQVKLQNQTGVVASSNLGSVVTAFPTNIPISSSQSNARTNVVANGHTVLANAHPVLANVQVSLVSVY